MEAEKPQDLRLASWRPKRVDGVNYASKPVSLETQQELML